MAIKIGKDGKATRTGLPKAARTALGLAAHTEPVAWLHTLYMEGDQVDARLTFDENNPFGVHGKNYDPSYDPSYEVTSEPLGPLIDRQ
jgi:hypothetical protein